jgi:photosystem II stability/assembly factor-like uncharacterized protein
MLARSNATNTSIAIFVVFLFLSLSFVSMSSWGPGGGRALADPGSGWEEQNVPTTEGEITSVSAVDDATAWATFVPPTSPGSRILKTQNGGSNWYIQALDSTGYTTTDVFAVDEAVVWAIGAGSIFKSIDWGNTWSRVYQSFSTPTVSNMAMDICATDKNTAWSVVWMRMWYGSAYGWSVARTLDGGSNWYTPFSLYGPFAPLDSLCSIDVADDSTLWMSLYGSVTDSGLVPMVLRSTDGGTSWETHELNGCTIYDICALDSSNAWAVGGDATSLPGPGTGIILRTYDGGVTWEEQYRSEGHSLSAISAVDAYTAWAVGDLSDPYYPSIADAGVILKTDDGGANWTTQYEFTGGGYISDITAVDASTAWVGGKSPSGTPLVLKTTDGGDPGPDIVSIVPSPAPEGYEVAITGCDFGVEQGSSYVSLGDVQAGGYPSWSDTQIVVKVPAGIEEEVAVTVTTPEGTSNPVSFTSLGEVSVTSVAPTQAMQHTLALNLSIGGNGFMPGAGVRLEKDGTVIEAFSTTVDSSEELVSAFSLFGVEPGTYDVVLTNPGGQEARLEDAFTVNSLCGAGSGTTLLMLGITLGLLSLAGTARRKRRRK